MDEPRLCPYCLSPVSSETVTLWDRRVYCRKCVEEVSPELYDLAANGMCLEERVGLQHVGVLPFLSYLWRTFLLAVTLFFGLVLLLAGTWDLEILLSILIFVPIGGIFIFLCWYPIGIFAVRATLPQTVSVEYGRFRVVNSRWEKCFQLTDCTWYLGHTYGDILAMFTGLRRGVMIQTPEGDFACGHTPEMLNRWNAFLILARIPKDRLLGCLPFLGISVLGVILGGAVGVVIGRMVTVITQDDIWPFALGILGAIDGMGVALVYASRTYGNAYDARRKVHPAGLACAFMTIGFMAGLLGSAEAALVCGSVNAVLGALVGWLCRRR